MIADIVTRKEHCPYCEGAKELFDLYKIEYREKTIGVDYTKEDLLVKLPDAKTVPQIWVNGEYVGGYQELYYWVQNNNLTPDESKINDEQ